MAIGDANDIVARLKGALPIGWFEDSTPVLGSLLNGIATALAWVYTFYIYAVQQSRIATATGVWLDLVAYDFLGETFLRKLGETDSSFRARIRAQLFQPRATRDAMSRVLTTLTGQVPLLFEPQRPADTGAYGAPNCGYRVAGGYGSMRLPAQAFITAFYQPNSTGLPNVSGYGSPAGGYSRASRIEYLARSEIGQLGPSDIYAAVVATKAEGVEVWVAVKPRPLATYYLDVDFILDQSTLS